MRDRSTPKLKPAAEAFHVHSFDRLLAAIVDWLIALTNSQ